MNRLSILLFFLIFAPLVGFSQNTNIPKDTSFDKAKFYRPTKGFTFSPSFGAYYEGFEQEFVSNNDQWSNIWAYGFRLGYVFTPAFEIESNFMYSNTRRGINRQTVYLYGAHLVYNINFFSQRFAPYLMAGAGNLNLINQFTFNYFDFSAYYGLGLRYFLSPKMAVRVETHAINNFDKAHTALWSGLLLTVYTKAAPVYERREKLRRLALLDSDKDGIKDDKDKCPQQPETFNNFEDEDGCPDTLPKNLMDSDKDGIMDDKDKCPLQAETMNGYQDEDGCPDKIDLSKLDSDKDGIADDKDKCPLQPETLNSYQDDDGCPDEVPEDLKAFVGRIDNIFFEFDSAEIQKKSYAKLNQSIATLKRYQKLYVLIEGHTDSVGSPAYNDKLSRERANSVKQYLIANGLDSKRLAIKGYGSKKPIANNDTDKGRAQNRRIEFKLLSFQNKNQ